MLQYIACQVVVAFGWHLLGEDQPLGRRGRRLDKVMQSETRAEAWVDLEGVQEKMRILYFLRVHTLWACPVFMHDQWRHVIKFAMEAWRKAKMAKL